MVWAYSRIYIGVIMALNFDARYTPLSISPDANYPFGSCKNASLPGAGDGTPGEKDTLNDWLGFQQKLIDDAGITPSGSPDTILASDAHDGLLDLLIRQQAIESIKSFDSISDMAANTPTNNALADDDLIVTKGYTTAGDGGGGFYKVVPAATGTNDGGSYHPLFNGKQAELIVMNGRYLCTQFGMFPDGFTDWVDNAVLGRALNFATASGHTLVIVAGGANDYYVGKFDNFNSFVTVEFEQGAIFGGTVHVAINTNDATPAVNRPQKVRFYGPVASYTRVGCFNCDDVYVERIHLQSDPTRSTSGDKPNGVHLFQDTKNMRIDEIVVDDVRSNGSYALGLDGTGGFLPSDISIGRVLVQKTDVHGCYINGSRININEVTIREWGVGTQTDTLINATGPESADLKAIWTNKAIDCHIGVVNIAPSPNTAGNGTDGIYVDDGRVSLGNVFVDGAPRDNFTVQAQVESPEAVVQSLVSINAGRYGINVFSGILKIDTTLVQNCGDDNVSVNATKTLVANMITSRNSSERAFFAAGAAKCVIGSLFLTGEQSAKNIMTISGAILNCQYLEASTSAAGNQGGIYIANATEGSIGELKCKNVGTADALRSAFFIEDSSDFHVLSGKLESGGVIALGQGLRMDTITDCSFNGLKIDGYDTNVAANVFSGVGFSNCKQINAGTTGTNLARANAIFTNAATMNLDGIDSYTLAP